MKDHNEWTTLIRCWRKIFASERQRECWERRLYHQTSLHFERSRWMQKREGLHEGPWSPFTCCPIIEEPAYSYNCNFAGKFSESLKDHNWSSKMKTTLNLQSSQRRTGKTRTSARRQVQENQFIQSSDWNRWSGVRLNHQHWSNEVTRWLSSLWIPCCSSARFDSIWLFLRVS